MHIAVAIVVASAFGCIGDSVAIAVASEYRGRVTSCVLAVYVVVGCDVS